MSETRIVVAIDFGTTYSGFACAHKRNPKEITAYSKWQGHIAGFKTPTVLKYSESLKLISWGWPALAEKPNRRKIVSDIIPVERFKLHLGDMEDKPYLPEGLDYKIAITDYLREMGNVIKETVKITWGQSVNFFKQVLIIMTVPAEFDGQAMKIMRKCAYDAGITNEEASKNLVFTTEPEAAAIYCMKKKEYHIGVGSSFMIVDCGGGTVDLTTRKLLEDDKLDEITEREGDFCGGSFVDDEFLKFIGEKVGEPALKKVRKNHYSQLQYMVQDFCRRVKTQFTGQESDAQSLHEFDLNKLCPVLKKYVTGEKLEEMEDMEWLVELTFDDVKSMFDPVIERIISLIYKQLDKNDYDICAIFLVGGFSESKYLQARVRKEFGNKVPNISVPMHPVTAVLRGAVQFGLEQEIVRTRVLKWTYGTDVAKPWVKGDPIYRKRSDGRVIKFSRLAKRGEQVAVNEKIVKTYYPPSTVQKKLGLDIYVTKQEDATYCNEPGVELLGSWCVDIPKAKGNRGFEFTLTFGNVEIQATAQAKTGETYKTTFDLDI